MSLKRIFLPAVLFLVFFLEGLYLIQATSPTTDETAFHMVNGYVYLKTRDYRMSPANPPLLREWMALPWLLFQPKLDLNKKFWKEADSVPFSVDFFYRDNRAIADKLLYSARFMILLLGFGIGAVVFVWVKELYGFWGAILSLSLYVFCPSLVAHSSIAHTDVGVTFFSVLTAYFVWKFLTWESLRNFVWMGISFGLACAAKFNAVYLGPVFLAVILLKKGLRTSLKVLGIFLGASFLIIWASYFFEFKPMLAGGVPRVDEKLGYVTAISNALFPGNGAVLEFFKEAALKISIPIPSYLLGLAGIVRSHNAPYYHYAFGEWTTRPHWYFYFFSFLVKMTIPFLVFLILRTLFLKKCSSDSRNENWVILAPTVALFALTMSDSTGVGVRYLFPVIPLLMVWAGGLAKVFPNSRAWKIFLVGFCILNAASALRVFPDYLSYFNESVGGVRGGYKYVRGSDVDWGQGLKALKKYIDKNKINHVALDYFGTADPAFYDIPYEVMREEERKVPLAKVYAISIFHLEYTEWSHELDPAAMVGGSIFIYDLRQRIKG